MSESREHLHLLSCVDPSAQRTVRSEHCGPSVMFLHLRCGQECMCPAAAVLPAGFGTSAVVGCWSLTQRARLLRFSQQMGFLSSGIHFCQFLPPGTILLIENKGRAGVAQETNKQTDSITAESLSLTCTVRSQSNRSPTQGLELCESSLGASLVPCIPLVNLFKTPGPVGSVIPLLQVSKLRLNTHKKKKTRSACWVLTLPVEDWGLNSGLLTPDLGVSDLGTSGRKMPAT